MVGCELGFRLPSLRCYLRRVHALLCACELSFVLSSSLANCRSCSPSRLQIVVRARLVKFTACMVVGLDVRYIPRDQRE